MYLVRRCVLKFTMLQIIRSVVLDLAEISDGYCSLVVCQFTFGNVIGYPSRIVPVDCTVNSESCLCYRWWLLDTAVVGPPIVCVFPICPMSHYIMSYNTGICPIICPIYVL